MASGSDGREARNAGDGVPYGSDVAGESDGDGVPYGSDVAGARDGVQELRPMDYDGYGTTVRETGV